MKSSAVLLTSLSALLFLAAAATAVELPMKLDKLVTKKGREYEKVEIREVTPAGIRIAHEGGTASLPYEELKPDLQKSLGGFSSEVATAYRNKQKAEQTQQEKTLERDLADLHKKTSPPAPAAEDGKTKPAPAAEPAALQSGASFPTVPAPQPQTVERGELAARIVGYRTGIKEVEFKVRTNCASKLEVRQVAPDEHNGFPHTDTFQVPANTDYVKKIWVMNNYESDIFGTKGQVLDSESSTKKTSQGGLTRPTLE